MFVLQSPKDLEAKVSELIEERNKMIDECKEVVQERNSLRTDNKRLNSIVTALTKKMKGMLHIEWSYYVIFCAHGITINLFNAIHHWFQCVDCSYDYPNMTNQKTVELHCVNYFSMFTAHFQYCI